MTPLLLAPDDPQLTKQAGDLFAPDLLAPDGSWFEEFPEWWRGPGLETGKVWVDSQGRVAARTWVEGACLLDGFEGECWNPVPSPTNYEAFHQGAQPTRAGSVIPVGTIGGRKDHAPLHFTFEAAGRYYENSGQQLMVGRAFDVPGEGGYFLGAIVPDATVADVAMIRRSALSCDWRWRMRDNSGRPLNDYDNLGPWLVSRPGLPLDRAGAERPARMRLSRAASAGGRPAFILAPDYDTETAMETDPMDNPAPGVPCNGACTCRSRTAAVDAPAMEEPATPDHSAEMAELRARLDEQEAQIEELQAAVAELMTAGLSVADLASADA